MVEKNSSESKWRTAKACAAQNCVQVAFIDGGIALRDSKNPDGGILRYSLREWRDFVAGVREGEFDDARL
ncbi:DUF397 domain-containing protein [Symbioplanes lichenis]|uniref:DUF397 domain-containing protein n=1 Tax=Symbioplanes lichenis TaxID=1629072 RepID=UPI002738F8E0|nr:DUF397 domain-containing protein [Actinoplanes lichenis]